MNNKEKKKRKGGGGGGGGGGVGPEQTRRQQIGRICLTYRQGLLTIHNVNLKNFLSPGR